MAAGVEAEVEVDRGLAGTNGREPWLFALPLLLPLWLLSRVGMPAAAAEDASAAGWVAGCCVAAGIGQRSKLADEGGAAAAEDVDQDAASGAEDAEMTVGSEAADSGPAAPSS